MTCLIVVEHAVPAESGLQIRLACSDRWQPLWRTNVERRNYLQKAWSDDQHNVENTLAN